MRSVISYGPKGRGELEIHEHIQCFQHYLTQIKPKASVTAKGSHIVCFLDNSMATLFTTILPPHCSSYSCTLLVLDAMITYLFLE